MTTTIDERQTVVTLINVFEVEPQKQDELVELLERAAVEAMQYLTASSRRTSTGESMANTSRPTPSGPATKTSKPCSPIRKCRST